MRRTALKIVLLVAQAGALWAQQDPCLTRILAVNATTKDGRPLIGLTAAYFRGEFRGEPVQIISATHDTGPRRIVILLDTSGSMSEKWPIEIAAGKGLVSAARPGTTFALLRFADQAEVRVGFTQGREAVADELARLEREGRKNHKLIWGKTALLDALVVAANLLRPAHLGDAIYLISDGYDNLSKTSRSDAERTLLSAGLRLFAFFPIEVIASGRRLASEPGTVGPEEIRGLVDASGGDYVSFVAFQNLMSTYVLSQTPRPLTLTPQDHDTISFVSGKFGREISEFDRLEIRLPHLVDKPRKWKLEVAKPNGKPDPKVQLIYPQRLEPCP